MRGGGVLRLRHARQRRQLRFERKQPFVRAAKRLLNCTIQGEPPVKEIVATLTHTPWWVYVLLVVLIRRGLAAGRPRVTQLWKLGIQPVIFILLDIDGFVINHSIDPAIFVLWVICLGFGSGFAYLIARNVAVRADRTNWLIGVAGDKRILPLTLVAFALKYAIAWLSATAPALAGSTHFLIASLSVSGFFTGIFLGRFSVRLVKFFNAPSERLATGPMTALSP
jgi:hypothetical protein